ncbi:hypothetical protein R3P38DRAFT_2954659 [Favolaschia claudopus]|uniref:Uncharacterized protein n=1 Tax=Favolaschia claudopus TaxID=2862362 RepID=A0AAW0BCX5_9AGAR
MAEKNEVASKNEKVFRVFKDKLSRTDNYPHFCEKFGSWLSNEKAYYPEARPTIVEILLIAEDTLRTAMHSMGDAYPALASAFIGLVNTVAPYQDRFEQDLQASLQYLLRTVQEMQNPPQHRNPPPHTAQDTTPFPTAPVIEPSQRMRPSSSSLADALTPTSATQVSAPSPLESKAASGSVVPLSTTDGPQVPTTTTVQAVPSSSTTPKLNVNSAIEAVSTSAPAPTVKTKKRKKNKKDDFSSLLQVDVQKYYEKRGVKQIASEGMSSPVVGTPIDLTQASPVHVPEAVITPVTAAATPPPPHVSSLTEGTRTASAPMPVTDSSFVIPTHLTRGPPSRPPTPKSEHNLPPPADRVQSINGSSMIEVDQSQSQDADMMIATSGEDVQLSSEMNDEVNRVLFNLTGVSHLAVADITLGLDETIPPPTSMAIDNSVDPPHPTADAHSSSIKAESENAVESAVDDAVDMDLDATPEPVPAPAPEVKVDPTPVIASPRTFHAIIEEIVNDANRRMASQAPRQEDLPLPKTPADFIADATPSTKIDLGISTVVAQHRGLASGSIILDFSVKQHHADGILKWTTRSEHYDALEDSFCLSLLCFKTSDIESMTSMQSRDLQVVLPCFKCSWPQNGGLSLDAPWKGQRTTFPLSPPFSLPPSGVLDVSLFSTPGHNTFRITQTRDMTGYFLLLCAHKPTPSQLAAVARRRHKEKDWAAWLKKISDPLQLPFSTPSIQL